jgi:lipopolysaccharide/colanic/teichoic acid biosynthesis glycosyltransferase
LKRILDIVISIVSIFLMLPAIAVIVLIFRIRGIKPVLAKPVMLGLRQKLYHRLLFCSDKAATGEAEVEINTWLAAFSQFLQLTGLDKLPQFLNVLIGDMSIVGPRPHPPGLRLGFHLCETVIPEYRSRFHMRPGITGLAQVRGTAGSDYSVRTVVTEVEMDLRYIRENSLRLDAKIIAKTVVDEFFSLEKLR